MRAPHPPAEPSAGAERACSGMLSESTNISLIFMRDSSPSTTCPRAKAKQSLLPLVARKRRREKPSGLRIVSRGSRALAQAAHLAKYGMVLVQVVQVALTRRDVELRLVGAARAAAAEHTMA